MYFFLLKDLSEQYEAALKKELKLDYLPPVSDFVEVLQTLKKKDEDVNHSLTELRARYWGDFFLWVRAPLRESDLEEI